MREDFLHYLWHTRQLELSELTTTQGIPVTILDYGKLNRHDGPDFLEAKVQIGDKIWAGQVEMHLKSSDWLRHQHQKDPAYTNVVLHVVMEEDEVIFHPFGERIPCLEIRSYIPAKLLEKYHRILHSEHWIPCQHQFAGVDDFVKKIWLERLLIERLEKKTEYIARLLKEQEGDWESVFYHALARNFGLKANSEAFEHLAASLPFAILRKHRNQLFQLEALLFGQAGLLATDFEEDYPKALQKEFFFLQKKYQLEPLSARRWRFMRLRPPNFPTIRMAQLAQLIHQQPNLFSKVLEINHLEQLERMLQVAAGDYWQTHYTFDKPSPARSKSLGKSTIQLIAINTVVPFLFLYGTLRSLEKYRDKALQLLETIPPERNRIIDGWKELGLQPASASETQALLQLKNEYCGQKRCLECSIGNHLLKIE